MKITVLDAKTLGDDLDLSILKQFGEVKIYPITKQSQCLANIGDSEIIITNKVVINHEIMEKTDKLKLIVVAATGYNNIDIESAKKFGITVTNIRNYSTDSVVQHTFAVLLNLLHNLQYYDIYVKSGKYSKNDIFTHINRSFFLLQNKTFGIIGLGNIGRKVGRIAEAFGSKVIYFSTSGVEREEKYPRVSLEKLLKTSDIISIHSPLNNKTMDLLNKNNIKLMKRTSLLINMGRGGIVNEEDIAKALDENIICCYGTDVLSEEPVESFNPLLHIKNKNRLLITPHIAWTAKESREKLLKEIVLNISEFINGKTRNAIF